MEHVLVATAVLLAGSLLFVVAHRLRAGAALGPVIAAVHAGAVERWGGAACVVAIGALVAAGAPTAPPAVAWIVLALALALQLLRPSFGDRVCAEGGVRSGWFWQRYEQLEEWRLSGEHLRFKVRGEWLAVDLPRAEHARVRARLLERAADRESRFHDRQEPQLLATRSPLAMPVQNAPAAPKADVADGGID
jgi:hypothetical protein